MKLSDTYNHMDNEEITENNLLLEKVQLQQKYLTRMMEDMAREVNMLVTVSRTFLTILKREKLTTDTEFEALVNTHHNKIEDIMGDEDKRYKRIIAELQEVNEQIQILQDGSMYGES